MDPEESLCPECLGVAAEDLVPSLLHFQEHDQEPHGGFWAEFADDFAEYLEDSESEAFFSDIEGDLDLLDGAPSFQGKPRF